VTYDLMVTVSILYVMLIVKKINFLSTQDSQNRYKTVQWRAHIQKPIWKYIWSSLVWRRPIYWQPSLVLNWQNFIKKFISKMLYWPTH